MRILMTILVVVGICMLVAYAVGHSHVDGLRRPKRTEDANDSCADAV
jgi:hypothetical protein